MKISRRKLAVSAVAAASAMAQAPAPSAESEEELLRAARAQVKNNGEALAKFKLPIATEPAFQFKA